MDCNAYFVYYTVMTGSEDQNRPIYGQILTYIYIYIYIVVGLFTSVFSMSIQAGCLGSLLG